MILVVDLDDFFEGNTREDLLTQLHDTFDDFRVTLFTIPNRCSQPFIDKWLDVPWVDLVPHGLTHATNVECLCWDRHDMHSAINLYERMGFRTKGFKAPGWQISNECYDVLLERGYWVADQSYNNRRRPPQLPVYLLSGSTNKVHGHLGHLNGRNANELDILMPRIMSAPPDTQFQFVRDNVEVWG